MSTTLNAPGVSTPIAIDDPIRAAERKLSPVVIIAVAATGSPMNVAYAVEATADDVHAPGYDPAQGVWAPCQGGISSAVVPLPGIVSAVRINAYACSNATITFRVGQ